MTPSDEQLATDAMNLFFQQEAEEIERKRQVDELLKDRRKVDEFIIENMRDLRKDIQSARNEISEVKADVQLVSSSLMHHASDEMKVITDIQVKHKDALYGMTEEQHVKHHRELETIIEERKTQREDTRKIVVDTKTKITWVIVVAFGVGMLALADKYIDTNHSQVNAQQMADSLEKVMDKALQRAEERRIQEATKPQSMRQP